MKTLRTHILVPLRRHDRVDEIIRCLESIAQPGSIVVFLIQRQDNLYPWWSAHIAALQSDVKRLAPISALWTKLGSQRESLAADETVSTARNFLQTKGITVNIELYTGSRKKIIQSYRSSETEIIVLQSGKLIRLRHFVAATRRLFGKFDAGSVPFLLLRPRRHF